MKRESLSGVGSQQNRVLRSINPKSVDCRRRGGRGGGGGTVAPQPTHGWRINNPWKGQITGVTSNWCTRGGGGIFHSTMLLLPQQWYTLITKLPFPVKSCRPKLKVIGYDTLRSERLNLTNRPSQIVFVVSKKVLSNKQQIWAFVDTE